MSPSQLEDELDAAGLKVMEVGDISPPSMETWVQIRKSTEHNLAKGGGGTLVVPLALCLGYGWIYLSSYWYLSKSIVSCLGQNSWVLGKEPRIYIVHHHVRGPH